MRRELLDLLEEAPPSRYGVEEAVAAGRRLRRKHRAGWAIAAAAAVVAAIGVPAILAHPGAPGPAVVDSATGPGALNFTFRGYVAGGFRVDDPAEADLGSDTALVHPVGSEKTAGSLRIFHPGTDPSGRFRGRTTAPADPIDGRPAFYTSDALWWQYADGRYAELTSQTTALNYGRMHQIAVAFNLGVTRPALVGFSTARLPANYLLVGVHGTPSVPGSGANTGATFQLASAAKAAAAAPDRIGDESILGFRIDVAPWTPSYPHLSERGVTCTASPTCYRLVDVGRDGDYVISATWTGAGTGPLSAALTSTKLAALDDLTTWWEAGRAFPASAQLPK